MYIVTSTGVRDRCAAYRLRVYHAWCERVARGTVQRPSRRFVRGQRIADARQQRCHNCQRFELRSSKIYHRALGLYTWYSTGGAGYVIVCWRSQRHAVLGE